VTAIEWLAALRRRWYVLVLVALCTGAASWAVHSRTIAYEGCEGLYISGPIQATRAYLNGNLSMVDVTGIVTETVMSQSVQQRLWSSGVARDYSVALTNAGDPRFPSYTQPTVQICATSTSMQGALQSVDEVASEFRMILRQMQSEQHVPSSLLISAIAIIPPASAPVIGRPSQAELGVLLIGLMGGIALMLRTDRILRRRQRLPE